MSGRYAPGLYAGVGGILVLVGINALSIPEGITQTNQRNQLSNEAKLEQQKAELAKQTADAYSKNGIAKFKELIISNYTLGNQPPKLDWKHTVDPSVKTIIYDKYRRCIGYSQGGKLYFINYYQGVCDARV